MKIGSICSFLIFLTSLWLTLPVINPHTNHVLDRQWTHATLIDLQNFEEAIIEPTEPDNKKKKFNIFFINFFATDLFNILQNLKFKSIDDLKNQTTLDFLLTYVQGFCLSPPR